jgi:tetratricopeptide (TPR) repeat protein
LLRYFLAWVYSQAGKPRAAVQACKEAAKLAPGSCSFPNALESVPALEEAMYLNPMDAYAPYLLGNFWYAHRRYTEAIECWENSRAIDPSFPTVHRNLGLAYFNKLHDPGRALVSLEIAFALDLTDARVFFELDQLEKRLNRPPKERLESLEAYAVLVESRDDLTLERIMLLNLLGRHEQALELLGKHTFHPWEGGEGKVTGQWVLAHVERARRLLKESRGMEAVDTLERAQVYPPNLGEGKLYGKQENDIFYYLGCAWEALGVVDKARTYFDQASTGLSEPASPRYYNDQPPEMIFYQGLAHYKLDRIEEATGIFRKLVDWGQAHLTEPPNVDYFAVSLPEFCLFDEDLANSNRIHCHFMMALGWLGLGEARHAEIQFRQVLALDANHAGAHVFKRLL